MTEHETSQAIPGIALIPAIGGLASALPIPAITSIGGPRPPLPVHPSRSQSSQFGVHLSI